MSKLTIEEIKDIIKNPHQTQKIQEAVKLQDRLKLHAEKSVSIPTWNNAYISWLEWVRTIINNNEKFELFKKLQSAPLDTVSLTQSIFSQYKKVFKTANPKRFFNFKNIENSEDFSQFIKKYSRFWETYGFEEFQTNICSFVVIDSPQMQQNELPEPYFYFLNVCHVCGADIEKDGKVEWIIYKYEEDEYIYIDSERYIFIKKKDDNYRKDKEIVHGYGFTPVRQFWSSNLNKNKFMKDSPISQNLGQLDKLLFSYVAKEDAQLYAKFPIIWEYEQPETHQDYGTQSPVSNFMETSDDGRYGVGSPLYDALAWQRQPQTQGEKSIFRSAGTKLTKPLPNTDIPDLGDPAGFVGADVQSLEFIDKDLTNRENLIWLDSVGSPRVAQLNQAINEKQVHSQFEASENILLEIKMNFEIIEKWTLESLAKIRYGTDELISIVVDYGDRFFLKSIDTLQEELKMAKESGMPDSFIVDIVEQMIETKYKNDSMQIARNKILLHLEPLPTRSIEDLIEINSKFALPQKVVDKKLNFNTYIKRFERENGAIERYLPDATLETKINNINQIIESYGENAETTNTIGGNPII